MKSRMVTYQHLGDDKLDALFEIEVLNDEIYAVNMVEIPMPGRKVVDRQFVKFQHGKLEDRGANGVTPEVLLANVIDYLHHYGGPELHQSLDHLLVAMEEVKRVRIKQLGTREVDEGA